MLPNIGILGVGMYLPPEIRRNDWWPERVVESWRSRRQASAGSRTSDLSEGAKLAMAAMAEQAMDPFQGAVERHIMPDGMSVFDMEERAARVALERAGIAAESIDLVLTNTITPDYMLGNPGCILHQRLGLPESCCTLQADAATYSFFVQLSLAEAMLRAGRARNALVVQSSGVSPLVDWSEPLSVLFGDGATAVVLGPVSDGRGIIASAHFTDGRYPHTLVASVPGSTWYAPGRPIVHVGDQRQMTDVFLGTVDACDRSIAIALARARHRPDEVDFLCVHQGTPWLRRVVQAYAGMESAKSVETFARTAYLFGAVVPAGLFFGDAEGVLKEGDLVVAAGGGPGQTYGAIVLRWGR